MCNHPLRVSDRSDRGARHRRADVPAYHGIAGLGQRLAGKLVQQRERTEWRRSRSDNQRRGAVDRRWRASVSDEAELRVQAASSTWPDAEVITTLPAEVSGVR